MIQTIEAAIAGIFLIAFLSIFVVPAYSSIDTTDAYDALQSLDMSGRLRAHVFPEPSAEGLYAELDPCISRHFRVEIRNSLSVDAYGPAVVGSSATVSYFVVGLADTFEPTEVRVAIW
ncbi:MAG: hypothetical protein ABH829_00900 [archaeon]